jgi:hypothetical protein
MEIGIFVTPAWMAGSQIRKDASRSIHVKLGFRLHAGTTQSRVLLELTEAPRRPYF